MSGSNNIPASPDNSVGPQRETITHNEDETTPTPRTHEVATDHGSEESSEESSDDGQNDDQISLVQFLERQTADGSYENELSERLRRVDATKFDSGRTPLHVAASRNLINAVSQLLEARAPFAVPDDDNQHPFHYACREGNLDIAKQLLGKDVDINLPGSYGGTPLDQACWNGRVDIVKLLLDHEANTQVTDEGGWTPLRSATEQGHEAIVELLLQKDKSNINICEEVYNRSPLKSAIYDNYSGIVELLVRAGADLDHPDDLGYTPLLIAHECDFERIDLLLGEYSRRNLHDTQGCDALHLASTWGYARIVNNLIQDGASIDTTDSEKKTALDHASEAATENLQDLADSDTEQGDSTDTVYEGSREIPPGSGQYDVVIKLLLEKDHELQKKFNDRETALHRAAKGGDPKLVQRILEHISDPAYHAAKDADGRTALYFAFQREDREAPMKHLVNHMSLIDFGGDDVEKRAIAWAAESASTHDIAKHLLKKSKALDQTGMPRRADSWSAIEWAAYREIPDILWLLLSSSPPTSETRRQIDKALAQSKEPGVQPTKDRAKGKTKSPAAQRQEGTPSKNKVFVIDMLEDPALTQTSMEREPYSLPQLRAEHQEATNSFKAAIFGFYEENNNSGFIKRSRTVKEAIYDRGPRSILREARANVQRFVERLPQEHSHNQSAKAFAPYMGSEESSKFIWVHLPATNVRINRFATARR